MSPRLRLLPLLLSILSIGAVAGVPSQAAAEKQASIHTDTPAPKRFVVEGIHLVDRTREAPRFFRGIGYSPYLPGETPQHGASPGDDGRYGDHLAIARDLGADYLHVFPLKMPAGFFAALDKTDLVYGQDIWIDPFAEDILDEGYLAATLDRIKGVIDHTYATGRPDRLVLFSVGDELQAATVERTNRRHPEVRDYRGRFLTVTGRSASEVALARLIDGAMAYELERYGQRHLYCHTSWTHIGPLADRPDLELARENVLVPEMGDLLCMNIYTYANGVRTSPPGSVTGTPYQGYLEELAAWTTKPVLVTQVGLSTSPIQPRPEVIDYGGHAPESVPKVLRSAWQDIRTARLADRFAGMVFFELHDEWWKIGWEPGDEDRHEDSDPEEWFGLYAIGEGSRLTPKGEIPATVRQLFTAP